MAPRFAFLRIRRMLLVTTLAVSASVWAQSAEEKEEGWRKTDQSSGDYVVEPGSKVPLSLINSVSTKHSVEGDRAYLETVFPLLLNANLGIPPSSSFPG